VDHPLGALSKIHTAQDDARWIAFELHRMKLASGSLFDPIAQSHELRFALLRLGPHRVFQIVHGGGADGTGDFPWTVNHRKQDYHPVKFVAAKVTACERHLRSPAQHAAALFERRCDVLVNRETALSCPSRYPTFTPFAGGGLISAILRRQSASESCGPETKVPLTFVLYQPDTTPSRSDSSVLTWRGERFCMGNAFRLAFDFRTP
jgi:hypothetical protein